MHVLGMAAMRRRNERKQAQRDHKPYSAHKTKSGAYIHVQ
jgi:hypothetical protein